MELLDMARLQSIHYKYDILFGNAVDIARLSFLAQRSITYLDLSTCELTRGCQSVFTRRGVIKHLDKISGHAQNALRFQRYFHISFEATINVRVSQHVYMQHLAEGFVNHIRNSRQKLKDWLRFFRSMFATRLLQEYHSWKFIFDCSIDIFFNDSQRSWLILEIVVPQYFVEWTLTTTNPKVLDFVLQYSDSQKKVIWSSQFFDRRAADPIDACLAFGQMDHVPVLLKYRNAPKLHLHSSLLYTDILKFIRMELPFLPVDAFTRNITKGYMSKARNFLLLQTLFVYCYIRKLNNFLIKSVHALRLIWRSLPHAYLSCDELTSVFGEDYSEEGMLNQCNLLQLYTTDVIDDKGEFDINLRSHIQPRTLAHYCRTRIRSRLFENYALSTGIDKLEIPNELKSFLRLEC